MNRLAFLSILLISCSTGFGQSGRDWQLKFNLLSPVTLGVGAGVEWPVSRNVHLGLGGEVRYHRMELWESLAGNYFSVQGGFEGKYYPFHSDKSLHLNGPFSGPYTGLWAAYRRSQVTASVPEGDFRVLNGDSYTLGLMIGHQTRLNKKLEGFPLDISFGAGYSFANVQGRMHPTVRRILFQRRGFLPRITLNVGINNTAFSRSRQPVAAQSPPAVEIKSDGTAVLIAYHDRYPRQKRKKVEALLKKRGFDPGNVDGRFDAQTVEAIRKFQRQSKLKADGKAGPATLKRLGF